MLIGAKASVSKGRGMADSGGLFARQAVEHPTRFEWFRGEHQMDSRELLRGIKFGSVKVLPHFFQSGELAVLAHFMGLIPLYKGSPLMTEVLDWLYRHHFKSVSFAPVNGDSVKPMEFEYLCVNDAEQ